MATVVVPSSRLTSLLVTPLAVAVRSAGAAARRPRALAVVLPLAAEVLYGKLHVSEGALLWLKSNVPGIPDGPMDHGCRPCNARYIQGQERPCCKLPKVLGA